MALSITVDFTDEQEAALIKSNESANPDPNIRPSIKEFVLDVLEQKLEEHVIAWKQRTVEAVREKLSAKLPSLSAAELAEVEALIDSK